MNSDRDPRPGAAGFVLPAVLFGILALTGILHGTLALARFHGRVARAEVRALQARLAAQSAVLFAGSTLTYADRAALTDPGAAVRREVLLGPGAQAVAWIRVLAPEWLWIEGEGTAGMGGEERGIRSVAAVTWSLDPLVRLASVRATVEAGGQVDLSSPGSIAPFTPGPADPGVDAGICGDEAMAESALVAEPRPATALLEEPGDQDGGSDPRPEEDPSVPRSPRLGLLDADLLTQRTAVPDADSGLWVFRGSLTLPDEGFHGVLAVSGDLTIPSGTELLGIALVGGALVVQEGGRFIGAARVAGPVRVAGSGAVLGSPCAVLEVLRALPDLSRPLPVPGGAWIPLP